MRVSNVFVESVASKLPPRVPLAEAVGAGFDAEQWAGTGQESVTVAADVPAIEMAVYAASLAIARGRVDRQRIGSLLLSSARGAGPLMWSRASFVANRIGLDHGGLYAGEASNVCNGLFATEAAIMGLMAGRDQAAMVVCVDRFADDAVRAGAGVVLGDGACCAILGRGRDEPGRWYDVPPIGPVLSIQSEARPALERMHRGNQDLLDPRRTVDVGASVSEFLATEDREEMFRVRDSGVKAAVARALADAGVRRGEVRWYVYSGVGQRLTDTEFIGPLGIPARKCPTAFGQTTGHMGPVDCWATFEWMLANGMLRAGDKCCLTGAGAGYGFTAMVVEVQHIPAWVAAEKAAREVVSEMEAQR
jgi:3-oxoacyl-[acyl-carrier-protein] synthase III